MRLPCHPRRHSVVEWGAKGGNERRPCRLLGRKVDIGRSDQGKTMEVGPGDRLGRFFPHRNKGAHALDRMLQVLLCKRDSPATVPETELLPDLQLEFRSVEVLDLLEDALQEVGLFEPEISDRADAEDSPHHLVHPQGATIEVT